MPLNPGIKMLRPPKVIEELSGEKCPQCDCARIFMIQVAFEEHPHKHLLKQTENGEVLGPYAS